MRSLFYGAVLALVGLAEFSGPSIAAERKLVDQHVEVRPGVDLPIEASEDFAAPRHDAKLAVIVLHGLARNVMDYFEFAREAVTAAGEQGAGAIVIAPQFLTRGDARELGAPDSDLRYAGNGWLDGEPAVGPAPVSGFEALDALLSQLANRVRFPNLERVVVVGHSGGGQLVQRFAILTKADAPLAEAHIQLRFVVANPSSYAFFGPERPLPQIATACTGYDNWKYGFGSSPPYHSDASVAELEQTYVARDVVYLLGSADTDPNHPELDKSCKAEAQGATRWERGHNFLGILRIRDEGVPKQRLFVAPGIGHDARGMLLSPCGLAAVFDAPGCSAEAQ